MYQVGVDIGGTFTDCVVVDEHGHRTISKSLTTYDGLYKGVFDAVEVSAGELGLSLGALLAQTSQFVHGTTVATNAVLTRRGAKTGLITTRGHEDSLIIGKVSSKSAGLVERDLIQVSRLNKPEPLVPPELICGVHERVDVEGDIIAPLDEASVLAAIESLCAEGVEAIAVSLLWSFMNSSHEMRIKALLAEHAPSVFCTLSSELAPVLGEYERTVTTVMNAYVGPQVSGYLHELDQRLRDAGLQWPLLVMQASDGLTSVADASVRPIVTLDSGPAGGVLGCQYLAKLYDEPNAICTDVGGTTFEVGLISNGEVPLETEPVVSQYSFRLPKVAVRSIGAGGGSIGWVDAGGVLRVGPQSARSDPGPACYGIGGTEPTLSDADLYLGYFDADNFLGGKMKLHYDKAEKALAELGNQLGMSAQEVAVGIVRITNAHMADLIRRNTIEQGADPRECVLVAYGGAGPTHAAFYGRDIGAKSILIPVDSTVFSAEGMLTCQLAHSAQASSPFASPFSEKDIEDLSRHLQILKDRVVGQFAAEGSAIEELSIRRSVTVHYPEQIHTVEVDLPAGDLNTGHEADIRARFEQRYANTFGEGSLFKDGGIEIDLCRITATRTTEPMQFAEYELSGPNATSAIKSTRSMFFEDVGFIETPVYEGSQLRAGNAIKGPALIERMGDSVVVPPEFSVEVDKYLTLVMSLR